MERCPNCGEKFLKVITSRLTEKKYRRRTKHCQHCDYRVTTVELPEHVADKYMNKQKLMCLQCDHNNKEKDKCDFSLPEYMTTDAQDCNLFGRCPG
jgi:DNA-directed RNA polymerase subunit RPC12/RpoP